MNKISRKGFLKIAAAAAMSGVTAGALAACNAASSSTAAPAASGAAGTYIPGTYEGTAEGISSTVKVTMTFSDSAVTDVVVDTSGETASYGAAAADQLREQLMVAGSAEIDGVSGSTITSDAVMKAAKSCYAQAKGEATVTSVQLPTGDENDWLGKEPDIDEAAITETVDTDILIVGAGNGGIFAAAYAAANGLNFRVIEQNGNVQDTRHWVGAVDGFGAQEQGIKMDFSCDAMRIRNWEGRTIEEAVADGIVLKEKDRELMRLGNITEKRFTLPEEAAMQELLTLLSQTKPDENALQALLLRIVTTGEPLLREISFSDLHFPLSVFLLPVFPLHVPYLLTVQIL